MIIAMVLAAMSSAGTAHHSAPVDGQWVNPSKSVVIKIGPCGQVHCGTVTWASDKAKQDALKGTKHLVGYHLLTNLKNNGSHQWKGKIFVPDQNMTASAKLNLEGHDHLKVTGCGLMGTICRSQTWTRAHHHPHA